MIDIIVIAVCIITRGADSWVTVAKSGRSKPAWLATFLALPNGIPAHDAFGRSCARIDPEPFQRSLLAGAGHPASAPGRDCD
ncbi:MAG: transposase family protein [Roseiflexus sp.]|nr:transposase family protein [Roseiflexus sp.]